jgi:type IV pilus assembly protein PilO
MADNPLSKMSALAQMAVGLVLAALTVGGFWYFWYSDKAKEAAQKETDLAKLEADVQALQVTANKLPEFRREVQVLEASLETLKQYLPPERETPDLMRKVQALAQQSNLSIKKFNPATPVNKDFYQEVPISVSLEGSYHNLGLFLDRISRLRRIVNVGNLQLRAATRQTVLTTITINGTATTYIYKEPVEPPMPPGPAGRK